MTVKPIQETQSHLEIQEKSAEIIANEKSLENYKWRSRRWSTGDYNPIKKLGIVHSQVLRIREEDLHLGEDLINGLLSTAVAKDTQQRQQLASALDLVFLASRSPNLPSSPLSGNKTTVVKSLALKE